MVNKLIKLILCFTISISFAQDNTNPNNSGSKYVNIKIEGMHCAGACAKGIESRLNTTEGLVAMVNFDNKMALVEYDTKLFSEQEIVNIINDHQGGRFSASLLSDKSSHSCSKGKQCCQKTGKLNAKCDNKSKGCCSSASKQCNKKK